MFPNQAAKALGNALAKASSIFGAMNSHDSIFSIPPITEIPDYVWSRRYDKPAFFSARAVQRPEDTSRKIPHPDAESALKAAKEACRQKAGRWFGSDPEGYGPISFCVYEDGKVVERHIVGR